MKFRVLTVFGVCFVQICFGLISKVTDEEKNQFKTDMQNNFRGVSDQFIYDYLSIIEKYEGKSMAQESMMLRLLNTFRFLADENVLKVDVNSIIKFKSEHEYAKRIANNTEKTLGLIENLKIFQLALSKQMQPERYNGIINWLYVTLYPNATTKELESAVDYFYGTENTNIKDPLINFPDANATDCPESFQRYAATKDKLKSMTDIKPEVLRDVTAIAEKFPCDDLHIQMFLEDFVGIIQRLHHIGPKVDACMIKENSDSLKEFSYFITPDGVQRKKPISTEFTEWVLQDVESISSTRLTDETFRYIINFWKAVIDKSSIHEIEKAMKYVFIDVPETNCSA